MGDDNFQMQELPVRFATETDLEIRVQSTEKSICKATNPLDIIYNVCLV